MIEIRRKMNARPPRNVENLVAPLFEGEAHAHKFVIEPMDGVSFAGYSVAAIFVNAEGNNVQPESWLDEDGNACVVLTPSCYAKEGKYKLTIFVTKTETVNNEDKTTTVCVFACQGVIVNTLGRDYQGEIIAPTIEPYPDARIDSLTDTVSGLSDDVTALQTSQAAQDTSIAGLEAHFPAGDKFMAGEDVSATGTGSAALGNETEATGDYALAEGIGSIASGEGSHAEGNSTASGVWSHSEGNSTVASHLCQHVFGAWNIVDPSANPSDERGTYIEIVGKGASFVRSNARTLDWSGNEYLAGSLKLDTITLNPHYNQSEEKTLSLVNCKKLRLSWSVEDGGEATDYEVEVTAENITALLALLTTFGGISSPLSDTESTQARTLISRYSGITNPLTASEITQLRALISGGGSGGGEEEPPAVVVDPDDPGTEDPSEEPPA